MTSPHSSEFKIFYFFLIIFPYFNKKEGGAIGSFDDRSAHAKEVEPGVSPSIIQDDLDEAGHICLFSVMEGEKRVVH